MIGGICSLGEYCSGQLVQRLFLRQHLECGISSGELVTNVVVFVGLFNGAAGLMY